VSNKPQRKLTSDTRSSPQLPPLTPTPDAHVQAGRWQDGRLEIQSAGESGSGGGRLLLHAQEGGSSAAPAHLDVCIPPTPESSSPWGLDDVRRVHRSIYNRRNVISIHLTNSLPTSPEPADLETRSNTRRTVSSSRALSLVRLRSSTLASGSGGTSTATPGFTASHREVHYGTTLLLVAFPSSEEAGQWYTELRALSALPLHRARRHRRLSLRILDLHEHCIASATNNPAEGHSSLHSSTHETSKGSGHAAAKRTIKAGWPKREHICIELWVPLQGV
jgi:hypothetical protein